VTLPQTDWPLGQGLSWPVVQAKDWPDGRCALHARVVYCDQAKGEWSSDNTFVFVVDQIGNNFAWGTALTFNEDKVALTMQDLTGFFTEVVHMRGQLER
jgi:hypothetical protein